MKSATFLKTVLILITLTLLAVTFFNPATYAQVVKENNSGECVDVNGDGYNVNAPDHDNDGIPNGRDQDFTRGKGKGNGQGVGQRNGQGKLRNNGNYECEECEK